LRERGASAGAERDADFLRGLKHRATTETLLRPGRLPPDAEVHVTPAEKLCLACGLCCDGTLFDNVRLGPRDDAQKLKSLGLPVAISRAQTPITFFRQPCAALCADRTCRLYADRPTQCRTFECGVFKAAEAGRITSAAALRLVKQARQRADDIRRLLRQLGDTEEHRPLAERFRRTQRRMESGAAGAAAVDTFAELGVAMHRFNLLAHEKFHTREPGKQPGL
jgi:Fe-S-cluster containining protein